MAKKMQRKPIAIERARAIAQNLANEQDDESWREIERMPAGIKKLAAAAAWRRVNVALMQAIVLNVASDPEGEDAVTKILAPEIEFAASRLQPKNKGGRPSIWPNDPDGMFREDVNRLRAANPGMLIEDAIKQLAPKYRNQARYRSAEPPIRTVRQFRRVYDRAKRLKNLHRAGKKPA